MCRRAVSPAGVKIDRPASDPAPDDHFAASPYRLRNVSGSRRVGSAGGCPTVRPWIVFAPGIENVGGVPSTPDDHFTASPYRRVLKSASGRIVGAGGCPSVRGRLVTSASIQKIKVIPSTPDDHLAAGPD